MNETNKILITRIKQGDKHEFNRLFFKYYAALCSYVTTIIEDSSVSEDIVQNMFIKFWSGRSKIAIHTNIEHYLFKAAKNGALNHLRSETNRKKALDKLEIIGCMEIEECSIQEEFLQKLEDCINQLPERSKEVFLLSRFEELKQKEIAEKLSISIKTIKNQIWKSLKYLKSCMEFKNAC